MLETDTATHKRLAVFPQADDKTAIFSSGLQIFITVLSSNSCQRDIAQQPRLKFIKRAHTHRSLPMGQSLHTSYLLISLSSLAHLLQIISLTSAQTCYYANGTEIGDEWIGGQL